MSFVVVIPARLASTRLPNKVLRPLAGEPMIAHVCCAALASRAARVIVATDTAAIADAARIAGAEAVMTRADHACGSDRIAEVVAAEGFGSDDIIVNLQADEPLMPVALIDQVGASLDYDAGAAMASAYTPILETRELFDPDIVKVVVDDRGRGLYFSRAPIPFHRDSGNRELAGQHRRHLGIYAYRARALERFAAAPPGRLERHESLEQLRAFDLDIAIAMVEAGAVPGPGIDTEADLTQVAGMLEAGARGQ